MAKSSSTPQQVGGTAIRDQAANMEKFLEMFAVTPMDEVSPETLKVAWVEYVEYFEDLPDGRKIRKRKPTQRVSELSTRVPMKIFLKMIGSQDKLQRLKVLKNQSELSGDERDETMAWVTHQVGEVWRLTEPDMTDDMVEEGLVFQQTFGLFSRFFGSLLKEWSAQKLS